MTRTLGGLAAASPRPPYVTIATLVAVVTVLWFVAHAEVAGALHNLRAIDPAQPFDEFAWVGHQLDIGMLDRAESIEVVGRSPEAQELRLICGGLTADSRSIGRGTFDATLRMTPHCVGTPVAIATDFSFVPAAGGGSRDDRELSYQVMALWIGAAQVPLPLLAERGGYAVEKNVNRLEPQDVLTRSWDAQWYLGIVTDGYSFNGDGREQQNVAWPFLYPYLARAIATLTSLPPAAAMLNLNAALTWGAMIGLLALSLRLGVPPALALAPPVLFAFNPFAVFLHGGFSEPAFICLSVFCLLALTARWWWVAAVLVGLMTATRFVGIAGVTWIALLWLATDGQRHSVSARVAHVVGFVAIAALGIGADMIVKGLATGHVFAAFQVRQAWHVAGLDELGRVFLPGILADGEYQPLLLVSVATLVLVAVVTVRGIRHLGLTEVTVTMLSGLILVAATALLNPDVGAAGRYLLALTISLPGILAYAPWRNGTVRALLALGALGASGLGFNLIRFYEGLAPY